MSGSAQSALIACAIAIALTLMQGSEPAVAAEVDCTSWEDPAESNLDPEATIESLGNPTLRVCEWARLVGPIEPGDYEKFRSFFKKHYRTLRAMYLRSPGGDVAEALKIGKLLRKYMVSVVAPYRVGDQFHAHEIIINETGVHVDNCDGPTCICASACALIWFGGVKRRGEVGIHRPKITDPEFAVLPPDQAASVYRRTLDAVSRYLEEMEAPRSVIDRMRETSSADIFWISGDKLQSSPSFREWVDASCGSFSDAEEAELLTFRKRESEEQRAKRDRLRKKEFYRDICQNTLLWDQRQKMPPP